MFVSRAFNIICILVYCGLYTMTIDVVTWRIIKKWCIWSLHLRNFLCLPVFCVFPYKLHPLLCNSLNFIYSYLKFKLGTEKHIRLKWVFLPQWFHGVLQCFKSVSWCFTSDAKNTFFLLRVFFVKKNILFSFFVFLKLICLLKNIYYKVYLIMWNACSNIYNLSMWIISDMR